MLAAHPERTAEESGRLVRLARLQAVAEDVLGGADKAGRWLRERLSILDGKRPLAARSGQDRQAKLAGSVENNPKPTWPARFCCDARHSSHATMW
jgi:hypothetical protein